MLQKPKLVGRMTTWSIELSEFGLKYKGRWQMKAQFLVHFLIQHPQLVERYKCWNFSVEISSNKKGSGASIIFEGFDDITHEKAIWFNFETSSNEVEYEALIV